MHCNDLQAFSSRHDITQLVLSFGVLSYLVKATRLGSKTTLVRSLVSSWSVEYCLILNIRVVLVFHYFSIVGKLLEQFNQIVVKSF